MKQFLKSEINGTDLFKKVVMFLLAYIVCIIGMSMMLTKNYMAGYFLITLLLLVSAFALEFQFISALINAVKIDDKQFEFTGKFSEFMGVCLKGIALSIVTFGIYGAWFEAKLINYITNNTNFPDKELKFNGTGGKLFKYILLTLLVPAILLGIILGIGFASQLTSTAMYDNTDNMTQLLGSMSGFLIIYMLGVFLITSLYMFYMYKWFLNFTFGDQDLSLNAKFPQTFIFIMGQFLLTMITFGIYAFAAEIKIFKYFVNNTILADHNSSEITKITFVGKTTSGFGLLLGQTLLCIITFGIYIPWAYANIQNWFISNIELGEE